MRWGLVKNRDVQALRRLMGVLSRRHPGVLPSTVHPTLRHFRYLLALVFDI
jgi:hypothetical protein